MAKKTTSMTTHDHKIGRPKTEYTERRVFKLRPSTVKALVEYCRSWDGSRFSAGFRPVMSYQVDAAILEYVNNKKIVPLSIPRNQKFDFHLP